MFKCSQCKKDVQSDQHGNLYCDCRDERLSENANVGWWHENEPDPNPYEDFEAA